MNKYIKPSRLIGNLYFAGTYEASTHLIDTGDGLILIDPGYYESLHIVINNIRELGFNLKDIKYILVSHAHSDHMDATDALVKLTGAKTFIGEDDLHLLTGEIFHFPIRPFEPDVLLKDGDIISLGNTKIKCLKTPGHTMGTISFFFNVEENGEVLRAGMFGGAGCNTLVKKFLDQNNLPYESRDLFLQSVERLLKEKVDVFIGNHVQNNNTDKKIELLGKTEINPFIDRNEWQNFLHGRKERITEIIKNNE